MDSYPGDFPFGIMDVVELLHLRIRRRQANSVYVDCPFCGDRRGKMNVMSGGAIIVMSMAVCLRFMRG